VGHADAGDEVGAGWGVIGAVRCCWSSAERRNADLERRCRGMPDHILRRLTADRSPLIARR
jgi:hypothetical protein